MSALFHSYLCGRIAAEWLIVMINYAPIPLLEASLFLANQAAGVFWTSYMERTFGKDDNRPHNNTLATYSNVLTELERRLRGCIAISKDTIQTLFAPLYQRGKDQHHPSSGHVCSILIPDMVEAYVSWEEPEFFCRLKQNIPQIPKQILEFLNLDECDMATNGTIHQLFSKINSSDLPQSSKLVLTDLALNPGRYIDILQEAMLPVATEFKKCQELVAPLSEHFHERYHHEIEETIMDWLWPSEQSRIRQILIYPSMVCSNYAVFGFNSDKTVPLGCLGSLYEFLRENLALAHGSGIQLTNTLAALSNRNRFNINKAFGRSHLWPGAGQFRGHFPVTISQHIMS